MQPGYGAQWYYGSSGAPKGPFTADQIVALAKSGTIAADTLIWSAGLKGWVPFAQSPLSPKKSAGSRMFARLEELVRPREPAAPDTPPRPDGGPAKPPPATETIANIRAAVTACFNKYAVFEGRAARPELWYFLLFVALAGVCARIVDRVLIVGGQQWGSVSALVGIAVILPTLAVVSRRLHDIDRSAWWMLIFFAPFGPFVMAYFCSQPGTSGPNRFG